MQYYPFDSRNTLYKSIYGAVTSEQNLKLRLLLHNDARVHEAFLCIKNDTEQGFTHHKLTPAEWLDDYQFFDINISLNSGLYWYYFCYTSDYGEITVKRGEHSLGIAGGGDSLWQLTVYDKDYKTPNWLSGGLIYQIFPDRFNIKGEPTDGGFADRYIQNDWSALPLYRQDDAKMHLGNDYFGGNLLGIKEKLPYLESLGVTAIYLNPIFEAHSNHRYNTANYFKIDPTLGTEQDLVDLCREAKKYGISIILDGVFSHTGDDSIYFNKHGRYDSIGAYNSQSSPYIGWYDFQNYPEAYKSWWGITTLPETNENNVDFDNFITGKDGVLRYWIRRGVKGWRLDVADELPDEFLDHIRAAIKAEDNEAFLLGEVWEDATNKISHGGRRRFLRGKQLDSVMNYPFADAIIEFLNGENARKLIDKVLDITENYPKESIRLLMNHIGTHDTARILTRLSGAPALGGDRQAQSQAVLSDEQRAHATVFLKLAATLQYTLPGVPSLYYGDEVGMEGYGDPFCRKTYPWGKENTELLEFYRALGRLRKENSCFADGDFIPVYGGMGHIAYIRQNSENAVLIAVNRWCDKALINVPDGFEHAKVLFGELPKNGILTVAAENITVLIKNH